MTRDEAAEAAGLSIDWYRRIEQGRAQRPSADSLEAIGRGFSLAPTEVRYMHRLLKASPEEQCAGTPPRVDPALSSLVLKLAGTPAYLLDNRWRIVAYNRAATILFTQLDHLLGIENNCLWQHFCDAKFRASLVDADSVLGYLAALFRYTTAAEAAEPWRAALIRSLADISGTFARHWAEMQVADWNASQKQFRHMECGQLDFLNISHSVSSMSGQVYRLVSYIPEKTSDTALSIEQYLAESQLPTPGSILQ